MKKTKIICTIGPSSSDMEVLKGLYKEGMNVARLNFSHGTHAEHLEKVNRIKELNKQGCNIGLLLDTKGPEIRVGLINGNMVEIKKDQHLKMYMHNNGLGDENQISITYPGLINDVKVGSIVRIDDGKLTLKVDSINKKEDYIDLIALNTQQLKSKKSVGVPLVNVKMPFISAQDELDIKFACDNGFDYIAASFTRCKKDIEQLRELIKKYNGDRIQVIAKIENYEGYKNIDEILEVVDGIMVARGDLGIETSFEDVPIMQKELIRKTKKTRKTIIIATHMLESMTTSISPTRAEVGDVANAVFEGVDAIMLSGETASGLYPLEACATQRRICERIEEALNYHKQAEHAFNEIIKDSSDSIAYSVASTALNIDAKYIFCFTKTGNTARRVSHYRPKAPIISISEDSKVKKVLTLSYGIYGMSKEGYETSLASYEKIATEEAKKLGAKKDDFIIITGGDRNGNTSLMKIVQIK